MICFWLWERKCREKDMNDFLSKVDFNFRIFQQKKVNESFFNNGFGFIQPNTSQFALKLNS